MDSKCHAQDEKWLQRLFAVLGIGVLIVAAYVFSSMFPTETQSLSKYTASRAKWNQDLVAHFPSTIPPSASLKKFAYYPGCLQGGGYIQLRLRVPPDELRDIYTQFAGNRTKSFFGGDSTSHINEEGGMPTTSFYTNDERDLFFPDDFEVMILDALSHESDKNWNHGRSHGVAISHKRNEIVYWAESW